jgi:hypothetical protein
MASPFSGVCEMSDKHFWLWLLLFAISVAGCEKSGAADKPPTAGNGRLIKAENTPPEKPSFVSLGKETVPSVSRTPDMPSYRWPADFKLPLVIDIQSPLVPKEIQGPSPPIEEEKKPAKDEKK